MSITVNSWWLLVLGLPVVPITWKLFTNRRRRKFLARQQARRERMIACLPGRWLSWAKQGARGKRKTWTCRREIVGASDGE